MVTKRDRPVVPQWTEKLIDGREPGSSYVLETTEFTLVIVCMITTNKWWLNSGPSSPAMFNQQLRATTANSAKLEAMELLSALLQRNLMEVGRAINSFDPVKGVTPRRV